MAIFDLFEKLGCFFMAKETSSRNTTVEPQNFRRFTMKKCIAILLAAVLALSLAACRRAPEETTPTTDPFTTPLPETTVPTTTMPSMGPNIPDPTVNSNSTDDTTETTVPQARRIPREHPSMVTQ